MPRLVSGAGGLEDGAFPVLRTMASRLAGNLSGGQQQMAMGRALLTQPSIVKGIDSAILSLKGHLAILLVEQSVDFAEAVLDHYVVLLRGRVVARGKGDDMARDEVRALIAVSTALEGDGNELAEGFDHAPARRGPRRGGHHA